MDLVSHDFIMAVVLAVLKAAPDVHVLKEESAGMDAHRVTFPELRSKQISGGRKNMISP
ncbi:hypothetical protein [Massilia sp. METH4]|uniref:hypothetical protein n=1 Tax=Massilia sp. METH4 TaxID=3123041 RepID=UPI0030CF2DC9